MPNAAPHRYSVLPYFSKRWEKVGRRFAFGAKNRGQWQRWRKDLLKQLRAITGYDTMVAAPLKPRITESVPCDGYTRQRIEIQTEPGVLMPLYALVPDGPGPFPAVLCPHGHGSGGKYSPAGRNDIPRVAEAIKTYNYDYGVQFCRAGFVAFCPDARGFGERQEPTANANGNITVSSCMQINQMAYPLGQTVTGMWAFDLHRLLDYVQTRVDCIPGRVGCAGLSGGGLQTLWATLLDEQERIKAAVVSGYFYGYEQSLLEMHTNCSCNYVPHLYETADMGDLGALIAPRPLLIETGDADPLNGAAGLANVTAQVKTTRNAYKLLGAPEKLKHDIFPGGHKWHGAEAIPWMKKWLA